MESFSQSAATRHHEIVSDQRATITAQRTTIDALRMEVSSLRMVLSIIRHHAANSSDVATLRGIEGWATAALEA